jgi:hypothetical protein
VTHGHSTSRAHAESRPWHRILSHKYPLEQINEAFAASEWHNRETTTITRAALTP